VEVSNLQVGDYIFRLQIIDTGGNIGRDEVRVQVSDATATTKAPLSGCQQLRAASQHMLGTYVPRCLPTGEYDSLQCNGHESTGTCWCSDMKGAEIPGTRIFPTPDCERGKDRK
jgi:hypothetical protein